MPLGPQPIKATQTWDMDGAAANFPDLNFVIFHVGLPLTDEVCWQLIRYPNLYASLAATINVVVAPRQFAEVLGKLLFWCGEGKILYGGEAPIFHPQWAGDDLGLPAAPGPGRGLRLPAAHRAGQAEDPGREAAAPARHRARGDPGPAQASGCGVTSASSSSPKPIPRPRAVRTISWSSGTVRTLPAHAAIATVLIAMPWLTTTSP